MPDHSNVKDDLTTQEIASIFLVKPTSVHRSYCVNGHYLGMVPNKLPNRRLSWSARKAYEVKEGLA